MRKLVLLLAMLTGVALVWLFLNFQVVTVQADSSADGTCNACHTNDLSVELPGGETLDIKIDMTAFSESVHKQLSCSACHSTITGYPHPPLQTDTLHAYRVDQKDTCLGCHTDAYEAMSKSAHKPVWNDTIICTDCHDPHYTTTAQVAFSPRSITCENCHSETGQFFADSVHGKAITRASSDLPYCTGCHSAHGFDSHPTRAESITLCSTCHADAKLMEKYGVSTAVVQTYLQDFHGKTAVLESKQANDTIESAVCTDCHGVHNIQSTDGSNTVVTTTGQTTCQKCHPGTDVRFASAWLSHCPPSLEKSPLVLLADWFYRLLIPFIVIGLLIHITLDLRHLARKRREQHGG